ncbi:hypothetical protein FQA39_LY08866 [Lamprigera yunnana]|nr:hypothetical protein FQA39_LY08866 [Lamprigera yunnana]
MLSTLRRKHLHAQARKMAFNVYQWIKSQNEYQCTKEIKEKVLKATGHGTVATSSETSVGTQPGGSVTSRTASETPQIPTSSGHHTGAKFRHGLLQLMIHTIDPLHDGQYAGKVDEKATQLHAIASLKVLLDATKPHNGAATSSAANHVSAVKQETMLAPCNIADMPNGIANVLTDINLETVSKLTFT